MNRLRPVTANRCVWERCVSQQSVRQAAPRSAVDTQAARRRERTDRERRLQGLAVAVLTALGERDGAARDAERRCRCTADNDDDEGLSVREVADWCGSGITVREVARLRRLTHDRPTATLDEPLRVDEHAQRQGDGPGQASCAANGPARWRRFGRNWRSCPRSDCLSWTSAAAACPDLGLANSGGAVSSRPASSARARRPDLVLYNQIVFSGANVQGRVTHDPSASRCGSTTRPSSPGDSKLRPACLLERPRAGPSGPD